MAIENDPHADALRLPEDAAHRLLARAVELDARLAGEVSIAQLRDVAREAGIAPAAFDDALRELRGQLSDLEPRGVAASAGSEPGVLRRLWDRLRGDPAPQSPTPNLGESVATNVIAFAAFWIVLAVVSRIERSLGVGWAIGHAVEITTNLFGVWLALRLRGRVTAVLLAVTAAMQVAEYPMHLIFGIDTVQGGPTKLALMLAGVLGIGFGALILGARRQDGTSTSAISTVDEPATPVPTSSADTVATPPRSSLRLRAT
jgi:hypothetical protein